MATVKLVQISKTYDGMNKVVDNVNLTIEDKEFMVIVGPSGCGKSTTLRMIAGLEEISSGDLFIDDKLVNNIPPKDRDIAMVFQNYALYPHMTVYDNIAFGMKLRKYSKKVINERVHNAAVILELEDLLKRKPAQLSGGQRQRVALGRAIVRQPKVFLFDEPLSNLDAKLRVQMRKEIKKLHRQLNATIIYVTHDQTEAMTMGDRIAVMNKGLLNQVDTPMNIYEYPINKFVAGFIGSPPINFIEGKISDNLNTTFVSNDGKIVLKLKNKITGETDKVTLGIRPENILLDDKGEITAQIDNVEILGNESLVHLVAGESSLTARYFNRHELKIGETINISLDSSKSKIFQE